MKKIIFLIIAILLNLINLNCSSDSAGSDSGDSTVPGEVKMLEATIKSTSIELVWSAPADSDIASYNITWTDGVNSGTAQVDESTLTYKITGLTASTEYDVSVITRDTSGNESPKVSFNVYTSMLITFTNTYYFIYTQNDLNAVRGGVTGYDNWDLTDNYILMNDIELTGSWSPLGDNTTGFSGAFYGNGFEIRGLSIDDSSKSYQGLFGKIESTGGVYDLGVYGSVSAGTYTGGLSGVSAGTISNCYSKATVLGNFGTGGLIGSNTGDVTDCYSTGDIAGEDTRTGGLIGQHSSGKISRCYSTGDVTGGDIFVGGLVGQNTSSEGISECFSTGDVEGVSYVGGLVGDNGINGIIINCYAKGNVYTSSGNTDGGLIGINQGTVTYSYSTGAVEPLTYSGGLVGTDSSSTGITNSFYDSTTSGMSDTGKGTPMPTTFMKSSGTFTIAGWDFTIEHIWNMDSSINSGYPYLMNNPPVH